MNARDELRQLLASDGILHASPEQPIRHLSGAPAPWAFYSSAVTLTGRGLRLAAQALLERLATFQSTQLAAYGQTAQPLLAACVLLGEGRYTGLSIRKQAKQSVTGRQVDGPIDRGRPVVILDDSIVSGTSLEASIRALEVDGFQVEGALALVRFPNRGGIDWAWSNGYRVETLYDIWTDLGMAGPAFHPDEGFAAGEARAGRVPDGLQPASAARWIAESFLRTGLPPAPSRTFDRVYEGPGGVFVSFRRRADDDRLARDGFWRFGPISTSLGEDLVFATVHTIQAGRGAVGSPTLDSCKIAVTLLGPLIPSRPADLDFDRYGIVVRDRLSGHKLGGALPNTQVFTSEAGQYWQARVSNARLVRGEEHDLFRHELAKYVEPGQSWLSYGVPDGPELAWRQDREFGAALAELARAECLAALGLPVPGGTRDRPALGDSVGRGIHGVAVSLYEAGYLASGLAERAMDPGLDLHALVRRAAEAAVESVPPDRKERLMGEAGLEGLAVSVVALHDHEELGESAALARFKVRPGLDALTVRSAGGSQTLLPSVGPYNGWGPDQVVRFLQGTPAGSAAGATWSTSRTASWVRLPSGSATAVARLEFGFVARPVETLGADDVRTLLESLAGHILRRIGRTGLPSYELDAISGATVERGTTPRIVHGLASLAEAGRLLDRSDMTDAGRRGLATCLEYVGAGGQAGVLAVPGLKHGPLADCVLLKAALQDSELASHPAVDALAARLLSWVQPSGRVARRPTRLGDGQDHEYLPAAVLMALAPWLESRGQPLPFAGLAPQLSWQRDQFRATRAWPMVGWHLQGWDAVHRASQRPEVAAYVFEVADWAIDRQLTKNGAFLEDLSEKEPSFNTGFAAEGIAAAWATAMRVCDGARTARYQRSWQIATAFIKSLTFRPEDSFASRSGPDMVGGVRLTPSSARLRIDATSHCLHAIVSGYALLEAAPTPMTA